MDKKKVTIYTDGACSGNPGPGGWGAVLIYNGVEKQISGFEAETTNNRMELTAAIIALETLKYPCSVELWSDSTYLVNSIEKGWFYSWQRNNWRNSQKKEVPNKDLWIRLRAQMDIHDVSFNWVEGHKGNKYNEICDKLAVSEYKKHTE
ncbi:MAG: ribonuclease HI [Oscillospiraceae bacterium]|nr:ribonuclease HI [Oscillospiraceae bacterium]